MVKKVNKSKENIFFISVLVGIAVISIILFSVLLRTRVTSISEQRLEDYADYNAYAAHIEIESMLSVVKNTAAGFSSYEHINSKEALANLRIVNADSSDMSLIIILPDGSSYTGSGKSDNLKNTSFFSKIMSGNSVIERADEGSNMEGDYIIIGAPVIREGKIVGGVIGEYDIFSIFQIIEHESFEGQGYSEIINPEGDYIFNSANSYSLQIDETNFLDFMGKVNIHDSNTLEDITNLLKNNKSGSFSYSYESNERISYITPLGINNWYLVKTVPNEQIESLVTPVTQMVGILSTILITISILVAFLVFNTMLVLNEQKNRQLQEAYNQAEHANKAKSQFLSRMSHEIRTPMNAIVGLTAIAKHHENEPEKVDEYLTKVSSASEILLNIINDVLDMSAIESEKVTIGHTAFDIKKILKEIADIYAPQCKQKNITFEIVADEIQDEVLLGDSLRVSQILLNLISNAYKFTPPQGKISVFVSETCNREGQAFYCFKVSDTGEGMSKEMQERLFQPFEQESAETAREHGGSGLGLSIAKNLVTLMHGVISVDSKKGVGTCFTVELPFDIVQDTADTIEISEEDTSSDKDVTDYDFSGKRVLLVEDNDFNRDVAKALSAGMNAHVSKPINTKVLYACLEKFI